MQLFSWIRNLRHRGPTVPARRRPQFRPRLEALEDLSLPSTLTVTNTFDGGNPGDGSLRGAIAAAAAGDTINFAPNLNGQVIYVTPGAVLDIYKNLTITGLGASNLAISGGGLSQVFQVRAGINVTLSGLTIEGGDGVGWNAGYGGGILNLGTLTVFGCTVTQNNTDYNVSFGNRGGGIYNGGTLSVINSIVSNNYAGDPYAFGGSGGGINNAGTLSVSNSTLSNNIAYGAGGGIYNGQ